jgi:hypothetical protein
VIDVSSQSFQNAQAQARKCLGFFIAEWLPRLMRGALGRDSVVALER